MGSSESKPEVVMPQGQLAHHLQRTRLQDGLQDGYVHVDNEKKRDQVTPRLNDSYDYSGAKSKVSISAIAEWQKELLSNPKNQLALHALASNDAQSVLRSRREIIADTQIFNIKIPLEGSPITNQRSSGRCWLFAATNVFRVALMRKHKLDEFELSQAYLFYWDKIEKANYFLQNILDTKSEPIDGRIVQELMKAPVSDGGQWDMVVNLTQKYGLVPQSLYPDSFNAQNSAMLNKVLTTKLREDALRLREMASSGVDVESVQAVVAKMTQEVHGIVTLMLGPPPSPTDPFKWTYYDDKGEYHEIVRTPRDFAAELSDPSTVKTLSGTDVHRLFSLVNDPRNEYMRLLTVNRLGNILGGRGITYVNVDMTIMKKACIAMLKRGIPVFFGSDVGKQSERNLGIMDAALYDYDLGFNIKLRMSKAERLMAHESSMTHAMVLTGVHIEDGKPVRWRVQNSWSDEAGTLGYFVMTDSWMDEYVYQAVVDPAFVSQEVRDVLLQKPKELELWDPMGALAL